MVEKTIVIQATRLDTSNKVGNQKQISRKQSIKEETKEGGLTGSEQRSISKRLSLAVVIFKDRSHISWGLVKEQMQKKLGKIIDVVPITDDRAVVWCKNENEFKYVLKKGDLFRGRMFIGKIKKWNMYMHWEFTQIEARDSWIGVEGLPLNLWNMEIFKMIGEACGGLLEVASETNNISFLKYAKLKVKGFSSGFLHPIVEVPCGKEIIHVGLFSLGACKDKIGDLLGQTKRMMARSLGDSYVRILKGVDKDGKECQVADVERGEIVIEKMGISDIVQAKSVVDKGI